MITHVHIENFRSFLDAQVELQPFSLIVGANGAGKSNLLKFFKEVSATPIKINSVGREVLAFGDQQGRARWQPHGNQVNHGSAFSIRLADGKVFEGYRDARHVSPRLVGPAPWSGRGVPLFNLNPEHITDVEQVRPNAAVQATGKGTTQVLDILKNGDREDLFDKIETHFRRYVPEAEKLSLKTVKEGFKQIQLREKGLATPTPGPELSEGTRLILAILTIIHQEQPPPIILLEDIDRGMHPRLFEHIAPLMRDIAMTAGVNILATTHNPYLVDAFQDDRKAVIIVEKKDGASTLSTLEDRLEGLNYDEVNPDDMPLGQLWFSGLVGGVPVNSRAKA